MKKRGIRHYRSLAKQIVPKKTLRKIKKVKNKEDKLSLYKHSLKSHLDMRQIILQELLERHRMRHDIFEPLVKSKLLNIKIKYFYLTHDKKALKNATKLLKEIEADLKVLT